MNLEKEATVDSLTWQNLTDPNSTENWSLNLELTVYLKELGGGWRVGTVYFFIYL